MPPRDHVCAECGADIVLFEHEQECSFRPDSDHDLWVAEPEPDTRYCRICKEELTNIGSPPGVWVCKIHSTRGAPV